MKSISQAITNKLLRSGEIVELFPQAKGRQETIDPKTVALAVDYLYWFGYLAYAALKDVTIDDVVQAVKTFQSWFHLANDRVESGKLGRRTRRAMSYDRCGCPDIVDTKNHRHSAYLALQAERAQQQDRWNKTGLLYYIKSYVKVGDVSRTAQEAIIAGAWAEWCKVTPLSVSRAKTAREADLIIDTGKGPGSDFDGPAGTLAWAYLPDGSDHQLLMRFDLSERWIADKQDTGILMFNVACHEFGHMLGLDHSRKPRALMAPFYNESVACPQAADDIPKVQALYGRPKQSRASAAVTLPSKLVATIGRKKATYLRQE